MYFELENITGLKSQDPIIKIFNEKGILFYFKNNEKGLLHFNLPSGIYKTDNKLHLAPVKKYKLFNLPKATVSRSLPVNGEIDLFYCNNPNKCSIDTNNHVILMDKQFVNAPDPIKNFIINHEFGHYFYANQKQLSEKKADNFSYNKMIEAGYNPSQIYWGANESLSNCETSKNRKNQILTLAKKTFI